MKIITNNQPRFTFDPYELSEKERKEFDYLDWEAIDKGKDSATFFRYKGQLYDLGEFMRVEKDLFTMHDNFKGWLGYMPCSCFSGILVKLAYDGMESVIVGRYFS